MMTWPRGVVLEAKNASWRTWYASMFLMVEPGKGGGEERGRR